MSNRDHEVTGLSVMCDLAPALHPTKILNSHGWPEGINVLSRHIVRDPLHLQCMPKVLKQRI